MPITYQQDSEGLDFYAVFEGTITPGEVTNYFVQMASELGSFAEGRALLEIRKVTFDNFTFDSIWKIAEVTKTHQPLLDASKIAVVAPHAAAYGIARMYIAIRDPNYDFEVFRTHENAILWLGRRCV